MHAFSDGSVRLVADAAAGSQGSEAEQRFRQAAAEPSGEGTVEEQFRSEVSAEEGRQQGSDSAQQLRLRFASCSIPHPEKVLKVLYDLRVTPISILHLRLIRQHQRG